jgi:hypothetical protein
VDAPIPHPMHRWYIGESKTFTRARTRFTDCKFNMFRGDPVLASSWIGSSDSASDTLYYSGPPPLIRKEIINYSASRLIDIDGTTYNLKNISTYRPVTVRTINPKWSANVFTFFVERPDQFAIRDVLLYGNTSLPLRVVGIDDTAIRCCTLFDVLYYDTTPSFYNAVEFGITILNAQFVNNGQIKGDITIGSNIISNIASTMAAFKVGDFIGADIEGLGFPANTRVSLVSESAITCNRNAVISATGVAIGNLICARPA